MQRRPLLIAGALAPIATLAPLPARAAATVGQPAPDFTLMDTAGKPVKLSDFKGRAVVLEWTNPSCPFVKKHYQGNMQSLQKDAASKNIAWLVINSTAESSPDYLPPARLGQWIAEQKAAPTATLLDESGKAGEAFAARVTPHMYIVNAQGVLVYAGGIDSIASARVEDIPKAVPYIQQAMAEIAAGKPLSQTTTRPYGCTIKYKGSAA
ncbi:redoxin domain-containing protein [Hydrogenophaga sp. IBVHS2]|uniref:redoxin domain-containing protein n=1 Tax=Hydrogenophaga sp. IBVHS2 TaxID=1985170 RepID=UPI000A2E99EF|nr:redoxin domain-containing protein [Hydrogenophaga sp. IBVHS2]OSZ63882.1 thioredoxin family protein [Hydrogenophaga sp. IBVHS2]